MFIINNTMITLGDWIDKDLQRDSSSSSSLLDISFYSNINNSSSGSVTSSGVGGKLQIYHDIDDSYYQPNNNLYDFSSINSCRSGGKQPLHNSMFGSLDWNQDNLLDYQSINTTIYLTNKRSYHHQQQHHHQQHNRHHHQQQNYKSKLSSETKSSSFDNQDDDDHVVVDDDVNGGGSSMYEHNAIQGLKPIRDRYLLITLSKMSAPIMQMFPELEGFTGMLPMLSSIIIHESLLTYLLSIVSISTTLAYSITSALKPVFIYLIIFSIIYNNIYYYNLYPSFYLPNLSTYLSIYLPNYISCGAV